MYAWQRRRLIRSSGLLFAVILALMLVWWRARPADRELENTAATSTLEPARKFRVIPLFDSAYTPELLHRIASTRSRIDVAMYVVEPGVGASDPVNAILEALKKAVDRGVEVRVVLDRPENSDAPHFKLNLSAGSILEKSGALVRFDHPSSELHDKLVILDGRDFVVGAHNWTTPALTTNREASLLVLPDGAPPGVNEAFEELWRNAEPISRKGRG